VQPKKQGCFFYGCSTFIILSVVVLVGGYFAFRSGVDWIVDRYTTSTPTALPKVEVTGNQYVATQDKIQKFIEAMKTGVGPESITLTAKELNELVAGNQQFKEVAPYVYFDFNGDNVGGKLNLPLTDMGFPGRYVSGEGYFTVSVENGFLQIFLNKLSVNGDSIPEAILGELKKTNLGAESAKKKETIELLKSIKSLTVSNGIVKIVRNPAQLITSPKPVDGKLGNISDEQ
jgi:hypothetical protein